MTNKLVLPKISIHITKLRQQIGLGCYLNFTVQEDTTVFTLVPLTQSPPNDNMQAYQTTQDVVYISNAFSLLQHLTTFPITIEDMERKSINWLLALQHIPTPLCNLFGRFEVINNMQKYDNCHTQNNHKIVY